MENASKALMIAGGVLLAILTLSIAVFVMNAVTSMEEAQTSRALAKQIDAFNKEYSAYDKRRMYGTEIITVINKSINHNKSISAEEVDPYYINISITTIEDFITTGQVVTPTDRNDMSEYEIKDKTGKDVIITLSAGPYDLGNWVDGELNMHDNIVNFFSGDKDDYVIEEPDGVYYIYSALTNFKKAIFQCNQVIYNPDTGRIEEMVFEQIKSATH